MFAIQKQFFVTIKLDMPPMMLRIFTRKYWAHLIASQLDKIKEGDVETFLRLFNEYFRRFRNKYIIIFILILLVSGTTSLTAWVVRDVVNGIFVDQKSHLIIPIVLAILAVFLVKGIATYFQTVLSSQISNAMVADVQLRMFAHILKQRISFFSKHSSDNLLMRFNQGAEGFNSILTAVLVNGSRDAATVIGLFTVMAIQDPWLTAVCFLTAPLVFYGVGRVLKRLKEVTQEELAGYAELNKHVRETVQGITVIKAFNLEPALRDQTGDVISGLQQRRNRIAALQAVPIPLLDTIGGIAVGVAILYAGFRTMSGGYDPGTFMSFVTALLLAADPARRLSGMRVSLKTAFMAVNMVFELLGDDQAETSGLTRVQRLDSGGVAPVLKTSRTPVIRFRDVHFAYDFKAPVLTGVDLDVMPGEMVALVGPSGAGKSTIFKLLLKFYKPTSGQIFVNGHDINEYDIVSLRDAISFVGQSNFIFSGSIRDNLALRNNSVSDEIIENACNLVGLHDFIAALPKAYDTDVGELGSMISGGQAQRLNIARAIIKDAPILLLDEVTSSLDAENEHLIKTYLQMQTRLKTVLVIAHRLSTVREADRIAIIEGGRIVDAGRHEHLMKDNAYYEKVVALQFA